MICYFIIPRTFIVLLFIICISKTSYAQTRLDPQVTASSGQHLENSNLRMDFTVGEFMARNVKGSSQITQGFQQSQLSMMIPVIEPSFEGKIAVFPNPVSATLTVSVQEEGSFVITIYDLLGTVVMQKQFSGKAYLDMKMLAPGSYGLTISTENKTVYTSILEKMK